MALPKSSQQHTRGILRSLLSSSSITLPFGSTEHLDDVILHLPVSCGDFTDFSCSREHVLNAGEAIQGKRYLPPGFLHFPIGYAGRASSIVVSGTPVVRPKGQFRNALGEVVYGLSPARPSGPSAAMVSAPPPHLGAIMRSGRISPCLGVKAPMSVPHGTDVHYTASTSATVHFHFLLTPKFSLLLLSAVEPRKHFPSYISMATYKQAL
jgi:hypothetical protein